VSFGQSLNDEEEKGWTPLLTGGSEVELTTTLPPLLYVSLDNP